MDDGMAGEPLWPTGRNLVEVEVLGQALKPEDGKDSKDVGGCKNKSPEVDIGVVVIANPVSVAQFFANVSRFKALQSSAC